MHHISKSRFALNSEIGLHLQNACTVEKLHHTKENTYSIILSKAEKNPASFSISVFLFSF